MRGGSRPGSGRKAGVPSVVMRVPVPCLDEVRAVIQRFRAVPPEPVTKIKGASKPVNAKPLPLSDSQKRVRKELERLPKAVQRKIIDEHGTLTEAVRAGVLPDGRGGAVLNRLVG